MINRSIHWQILCHPGRFFFVLPRLYEGWHPQTLGEECSCHKAKGWAQSWRTNDQMIPYDTRIIQDPSKISKRNSKNSSWSTSSHQLLALQQHFPIKDLKSSSGLCSSNLWKNWLSQKSRPRPDGLMAWWRMPSSKRSFQPKAADKATPNSWLSRFKALQSFHVSKLPSLPYENMKNS